MRHMAPSQDAPTARDEFLTSGAVTPGAVGETILTSWRRSRIAGVDVTAPDVPFDESVPQSRLAACAEPVLDRLQDRLDGMPVTIALTTADGRILERRERDPSLARQLDRVYFARGFSYAETHVGTNGVGTAIEDGRPVYVNGFEHFTERSSRFACAGAPIRNPLTRRVEGLINISSMAVHGHPMMRALSEEASHSIESLLLDDGGERQRVVLEKFRSVCRRNHRAAVFSVYDDIVIANRLASSVLSPEDEEMLRLTATDVGDVTSRPLIEMSLSDGRQAQIHCHPISLSRKTVGTVFEIRLPSARPARRTRSDNLATPVPGLCGRSRAWLDTCSQAYQAARRRELLLIGGEHGSGKFTLAQAVCRASHPDWPTTVVDVSQEGLPTILDRLTGLLPSTTVILRHLDRLDVESQFVVAGVLDDLGRTRPDCLIMGTAGESRTVSAQLGGRFAASVTIPPLRHRGEDLPELVSLFLRRIAPERKAACTSEALSVLSRNRWPGNLTELHGVLREAIGRRPAGPIRADDLPSSCFTTSRRKLAPIEDLERDAIVDALLGCDGNRKLAAEQLQISRSSLYRKIHAYGITEA